MAYAYLVVLKRGMVQLKRQDVKNVKQKKKRQVENEKIKSKKEKKKEDESKLKVDDYIKGVDKLPIEQGRWGFLPLSIQAFLNIDNKKCQVSKTNTNLKKMHPCLLRHGVQLNKNQSCIACIADILVEFSL